MNIIKKLAALALVIIMALGVTACHKKDEVALTIGEWEFTSAYYLCALVNADMEASQEAYNLVMSGEYKGEVDIEDEDYRFDVKIDGKKYETWVKDKALDTLKTVAAYKTACKKNNIKPSENDLLGVEQIVVEEWGNYGALFEANGVSAATYLKYRTDDYYSELYFGFLYEEDGTKEVPKEDIQKYYDENYVLINVIGEDLSSLEKEQKTEKKNRINGYYEKLVSGEMTFEKVYKEYNNITDDKTTTESTTEDKKEEKPIDQYASLISKADGGDHFKTIMELKVGDIKILNGKDDSDILLVVKKDANGDPYYIKNLDTTIRHALKDKDFEKEIESIKKALKVEKNDFAVDRFDVDDIEYPQATA